MTTDSENPAAAVTEWLARWAKGPSRTRWEKIPLQVGDPALDFELLDHSGKPRHPRDAWKGRPGLLLF